MAACICPPIVSISKRELYSERVYPFPSQWRPRTTSKRRTGHRCLSRLGRSRALAKDSLGDQTWAKAKARGRMETTGRRLRREVATVAELETELEIVEPTRATEEKGPETDPPIGSAAFWAALRRATKLSTLPTGPIASNAAPPSRCSRLELLWPPREEREKVLLPRWQFHSGLRWTTVRSRRSLPANGRHHQRKPTGSLSWRGRALGRHPTRPTALGERLPGTLQRRVAQRIPWNTIRTSKGTFGAATNLLLLPRWSLKGGTAGHPAPEQPGGDAGGRLLRPPPRAPGLLRRVAVPRPRTPGRRAARTQDDAAGTESGGSF